MATIQCFEDLEIWRMARNLCKHIYRFYTDNEQFLRDYKLKEQINDSSGSVMDNIAEGFERGGNKEFINFLSIAKGSHGETKSQLYRAYDRDYISREELLNTKIECEELANKIGKLMSYLNKSGIKGTKFKDRNLG